MISDFYIYYVRGCLLVNPHHINDKNNCLQKNRYDLWFLQLEKLVENYCDNLIFIWTFCNKV